MSVTAAELLPQIKRQLNQAGNMTLAAVPDGLGGFTLQNDAVLLFLANRAMEWIAENVYVIYGQGTQTALAIGTQTYQLQKLTMNAGVGKMWAAKEVKLGATFLQRVVEGRLDTNVPGKSFAANGTTAYWHDAGQPDTIGLFPFPAIAQTLTVTGFCNPVPLSLTAGAGVSVDVSFLPDPIIWQVIPPLAACMVAEQNYDDANIYNRLEKLEPRAAMVVMKLYGDLDKNVRDWRYPNPPMIAGADGG